MRAGSWAAMKVILTVVMRDERMVVQLVDRSADRSAERLDDL